MLKLQLLLLCLCLREIWTFPTNSSTFDEDSESEEVEFNSTGNATRDFDETTDGNDSVNDLSLFDDMFEDDIVYDNRTYVNNINQADLVNSNISRFDSSKYLWENATIPYKISKNFTETQKGFIQTAMDTVHNYSCVRFVPFKKNQHTNFISIQKHKTRCSSHVGRKGGGKQEVNFADHCFENGHGKVLHELLHAVGFWHEHQRPDQKTYVDIVWENVPPARQHNFVRRPYGYIQDACNEYDFYSIMHYPMNETVNKPLFRYKGQRRLKKPTAVGQRLYLSRRDKIKLNHMYNCQIHDDEEVEESDLEMEAEVRQELMVLCEEQYSDEMTDLCMRLLAQLQYCPADF